jgi:hypothetical protein
MTDINQHILKLLTVTSNLMILMASLVPQIQMQPKLDCVPRMNRSDAAFLWPRELGKVVREIHCSTHSG